MSYVEEEYAELALSKQLKYKKITNSSAFKLRCRCPVCGDSKSDENKARFWARGVDDTVLLHCFNCEYSANIVRYLKEYEEELYREYLVEKRKSQFTYTPPKKEESKPKEKAYVEYLPYSVRIDTLSEDNKIVQYIKKRKLPSSAYSKIYFTKEWQKLVNEINPGTYSYPRDEMRLVIPIFSKEGKIESFQGRALKKDDSRKYITIKADENASKIYGLERVKEDNPIFVMEGPIDSLFIPNAIAITGGSLDLNEVPFPEKRIWVMDNEPRHPDTIKRMTKLVKAGEKVVFWDKWNVEGKDINEFVINGATRMNILQYILGNYESGLKAKLRLAKYAKV